MLSEVVRCILRASKMVVMFFRELVATTCYVMTMLEPLDWGSAETSCLRGEDSMGKRFGEVLEKSECQQR